MLVGLRHRIIYGVTGYFHDLWQCFCTLASIKLELLDYRSNALVTLTVDNDGSLIPLRCDHNRLTSVDVSNCPSSWACSTMPASPAMRA